MTTETVTRGFPNTCPACGVEDCLTVDLDDVAQIHCKDCDAEMTVLTLRTTITQLAAILEWLETAPERKEET